jgi:hypothetical protein
VYSSRMGRTRSNCGMPTSRLDLSEITYEIG